MLEGAEFLLDIAEGYRRAIALGDTDQVLADLAMRDWQTIRATENLSAGHLDVVQELFDLVELHLATGDPGEALVVIERLRAYLLDLGAS